MLTVVLGAVAVGVPALAPFASLVCMVLVVFKGLEIERDEIWFSTFTLLTGALALVPSMSDDVCTGITEGAQACFVCK